jgi:hypothetical protein
MMYGTPALSYEALLRDIEEQINEGWTSVRKIESASYGLASDNDYETDEHDFEVAVFESVLERIFLSISLLLESLGYQSLLSDFKLGYKKFDGKLTNISMLPYVGEFHSDVLGYFWQYHRTVSSLFGVDIQNTDERKQRALFESIVQNTPKIVYDRGIMPASEKDVRKCVFDVLIHAFPDTVREIPVSQVTKTYKPDLGVRSLKTAAEYKYAISEQEAKTIIGGFYEDMRGYAGSEDWKYFYAVVYMTKPFFTIQQIQAEFANVKADKNWIPILVHGEGQRKPKP